MVYIDSELSERRLISALHARVGGTTSVHGHGVDNDVVYIRIHRNVRANPNAQSLAPFLLFPYYLDIGPQASHMPYFVDAQPIAGHPPFQKYLEEIKRVLEVLKDMDIPAVPVADFEELLK